MKYFALILLLLSPEILESSDSQRNKIFKNLKCLVCDGQAISSSEAEFAKSMRKLVDDYISEGKTEKDINLILKQTYGDEIFFDPPHENATLILWYLPFFIIIAGIFLVFIKQRKYKPESD